jgi:predicted RNA-binding Zn-ribbon protein involved in translation (DUF1610 family)
MAIVVACSGCNSQLRVRDQLIGKSFKCPKCGQILRADVPVAEMEMIEPEPPAPAGVKEECPPASGRRRNEEAERRPRRKSKFARCPNCGDNHAKRVLWTFWGSFYGPALLAHVRCSHCGKTYNGRSGRSNLIPAILFLLVTLGLIFVVLVVIGWIIWSRLFPS